MSRIQEVHVSRVHRAPRKLSLRLWKSAVISLTPYLWKHFFCYAVHANWVADLDTASNSHPLAWACNFKAHHTEPVKTVVCKREETQSRSTKDSATLFIAGGRHENCVQSLKDCSEEIQVPLAKRWWGAFNSSPCKWLPSLVLRLSPSQAAQMPSAVWAAQGTGTHDMGALWDLCPLELPLKAGRTPRKAAVCASCLRRGQQERHFNQWKHPLLQRV